MSTKRRTLGVYASPPPAGPNGERLCRNCRKELEKGQRHNCSPKCSDEWMCRTSPGHLRWVLQQRDKGICAICGIDTIAAKKAHREIAGSWHLENPASRSYREQHGVPPGRAWSDWWDADHIVPVIEGGGECGPEGYRTLCIPCHRKVTAELRKRMSKRRVEAKPLPLLEQRS